MAIISPSFSDVAVMAACRFYSPIVPPFFDLLFYINKKDKRRKTLRGLDLSEKTTRGL
jgi:hypothetical protein